ncbi:MAG: stage III sporulation protein AF [Clostridiales bacterium]|nr:stage III sporulation protein AF [Clostridiales bacterium]
MIFREYINKMIHTCVFILLLELLVPANTYKKYFNLCAGFVIIGVMLNPIVTVITKGVSPSVVNFSDMSFLDRRDLIAKKDMLRHSDTLINVYDREVRGKILEMLKEIDIKVRKINIHINKDNESKDFGEIEKLSLVVGTGHSKKDNLENEVVSKLSKGLNIGDKKIRVVVVED